MISKKFDRSKEAFRNDEAFWPALVDQLALPRCSVVNLSRHQCAAVSLLSPLVKKRDENCRANSDKNVAVEMIE